MANREFEFRIEGSWRGDTSGVPGPWRPVVDGENPFTPKQVEEILDTICVSYGPHAAYLSEVSFKVKADDVCFNEYREKPATRD